MENKEQMKKTLNNEELDNVSGGGILQSPEDLRKSDFGGLGLLMKAEIKKPDDEQTGSPSAGRW